MREVQWTDEAKDQAIQHIVSELASGRPVSRVLREDDGMPHRSTFYGWLFSDDGLADKVERAREFGATALIDEATDIADDATDDAEIVYDEKGRGEDRQSYPRARINGKAIRRASLQVDTRLKLAAMIAPRRYGAKLDLTSGGDKLPAPAAAQTKVDALIAIGVDRALRKRLKQLPPPEETKNDPFE